MNDTSQSNEGTNDAPSADGNVVDDLSLVRAAQNGDLKAFDTLVTAHRGKIYAMIYNMLHNQADALDLTQEAFIKAWKALPKFEARSNQLGPLHAKRQLLTKRWKIANWLKSLNMQWRNSLPNIEKPLFSVKSTGMIIRKSLS